MNIFPNTSSSIKDIYKATFELYKQSFTKIYWLSLIIALLATLGFIFATVTSKNALHMSPAVLMYITTGSLLVMLLNAYFGSVLLHRMWILGTDQQQPLTFTFKFILSKYLRLLSMFIILSIASFLLMSLFVAPGKLFIIILGIILMAFLFVMFFFVWPLIILDDNKVFQAFKNSWQMGWKNCWRTVAVIFPILFVGIIFTFILNEVLGGNFIGYIIINIIFDTLFYPLSYAFILMQYNDLKLRKGIFG
jgi:hypothetical protein